MLIFIILFVIIALKVLKKCNENETEQMRYERAENNVQRKNIDEFKKLTIEMLDEFLKIKYYLSPLLSNGVHSISVNVFEEGAYMMMSLNIDEKAARGFWGENIMELDKEKVLEYLLTRDGVNKFTMKTLFKRISVAYSGCYMIFPHYDYPQKYDVKSARRWVEEHFRNQGLYRIEKKEDGIKIYL